jgi:hypothetical protein
MEPIESNTRAISQEPSLIQPNKEKFPKKNIILGLLITIVIVIGSITYHLQFNTKHSNKNIDLATDLPAVKQDSNTPTPQKSSYKPIDLNSTWQAGTHEYKSDDLEILFSYPKSFQVSNIDAEKENKEFKENYPDIDFTPYGDYFLSFYTPPAHEDDRQKTEFDWQTYDSNSMRINLDIYNNTSDQTLDSFLKAHYARVGNDGKTSLYEVLSRNLTAYSYPKNGSYVYEGSLTEHPIKKVFFSHKNKIYVFSMTGGNNTGYQYSQASEKVFDQVIKSIELL